MTIPISLETTDNHNISLQMSCFGTYHDFSFEGHVLQTTLIDQISSGPRLLLLWRGNAPINEGLQTGTACSMALDELHKTNKKLTAPVVGILKG